MAPPSARAANAWVIAQATRDPYVILIAIYIFAPYYVTRVVGDPVLGQTLVAAANKWGGWMVMLGAPLLGASIDRIGPRKPWFAVVVMALVLLIASLWFTPPGSGGLPGGAVVAILAAITALFAFHEMLHNALLLPAAGMAGAAPLWGLDPALGEPDRITTLIVAATMALGALPLLLRVPDMPRTALPIAAAVRAGAGDLARLVRDARGHRDALLFLAARMVYTDGLTAILVFGGLYAAGSMRWATLEMLGYGITLSVAAVIGGLLAGWLDTRIGPKLAVKLELLLLIVMQTLVLGMGRERLLFRPWHGAALWDGPMFTTVPEITFLALGCGVAIAVTAAYASSRTLLTRVAPPDKLGVFFGLYVLSGSATMWLGPLLVEAATRWGGTQAWGMAPVVGMLAVGLGLLMLVKGGGRMAHD